MNVERDLETERATVTSLQEQLEDLQSVGQAKKVVEEELRTLKEESTISGSSLQERINALEDEIRVTKESNQEMAASLQKQAKDLQNARDSIKTMEDELTSANTTNSGLEVGLIMLCWN